MATAMEPPRLLVVDDNPHFSQLVGSVFEGKAEVLLAPDGEVGMRLALDKAPRVILLDLRLPKVSGLEVLRGLQSEPRTRAIPVVLMTGNPLDPAARERLEREPNVRALLQKPISPQDLLREVTKAMETGEKRV